MNAEPYLYEHHVVMIQGDDLGTGEVEPDNEIVAIERFFLSVLWNESVVEVPVPKGAKSMSIDQFVYLDGEGFFPVDYNAYWGTNNPPFKQFIDMEDMECCIANEYAWGFPEGADRNLTFSVHMDSEADFNQRFDNITSDDVWNFSGNNIKLEPGQAFGDYISQSINNIVIGSNIIDFVNVTEVEMSWNASMHEENITFYISNNGSDWYNMNEHEGEEINFTASGDELKWKINMTQDTELNNTPVLDELWINVTFTPMYNDIILQLTYVIERDPDTDKFEYTIDFNSDYFYRPFLHIIIYINNDYILNTTGVQLTLFEEQTEYSDKHAYIYMNLSGATTNFAAVTVQTVPEEKEDAQFPWIYPALLILILLIIGIILIARARRREVTEPQEAQTTETQDEEIEKLGERKEVLLKAIKKLDTDFEEGLLDEEVYKELRNDYKMKAADVMKQMDVLAASGASTKAVSETSPEREALLEKKEKILKSIKKLDNDYNEGLLDEDVYNELRADYKKKAVDIVKELDADQ